MGKRVSFGYRNVRIIEKLDVSVFVATVNYMNTAVLKRRTETR